VYFIIQFDTVQSMLIAVHKSELGILTFVLSTVDCSYNIKLLVHLSTVAANSMLRFLFSRTVQYLFRFIASTLPIW